MKSAINSHTIMSNTFYWKEVDIIDDDNLYELYALKIPVLRVEQNQQLKEIFWPFTQRDITDLIDNE